VNIRYINTAEGHEQAVLILGAGVTSQ